MRTYLQNQKGNTLVTVVIAAAIIVGLALVVSNYVTNSITVTVRTGNIATCNQRLNSIMNEIKSMDNNLFAFSWQPNPSALDPRDMGFEYINDGRFSVPLVTGINSDPSFIYPMPAVVSNVSVQGSINFNSGNQTAEERAVAASTHIWQLRNSASTLLASIYNNNPGGYCNAPVDVSGVEFFNDKRTSAGAPLAGETLRVQIRQQDIRGNIDTTCSGGSWLPNPINNNVDAQVTQAQNFELTLFLDFTDSQSGDTKTCSTNTTIGPGSDTLPPQFSINVTSGFTSPDGINYCNANSVNISFDQNVDDNDSIFYFCRVDYFNDYSGFPGSVAAMTGWYPCGLFSEFTVPGAGAPTQLNYVSQSGKQLQLRFDNLVEGVFRLNVKAVDAARNESIQSAYFGIDTSRPTGGNIFYPTQWIRQFNTGSSPFGFNRIDVASNPWVNNNAFGNTLFQCAPSTTMNFYCTGVETRTITSFTNSLTLNGSPVFNPVSITNSGEYEVVCSVNDLCNGGSSTTFRWTADLALAPTNNGVTGAPGSLITLGRNSAAAMTFNVQNTNVKSNNLPYVFAGEVYNTGGNTFFTTSVGQSGIPQSTATTAFNDSCGRIQNGFCSVAYDGCGRVTEGPHEDYRVDGIAALDPSRDRCTDAYCVGPDFCVWQTAVLPNLTADNSCHSPSNIVWETGPSCYKNDDCFFNVDGYRQGSTCTGANYGIQAPPLLGAMPPGFCDPPNLYTVVKTNAADPDCGDDSPNPASVDYTACCTADTSPADSCDVASSPVILNCTYTAGSCDIPSGGTNPMIAADALCPNISGACAPPPVGPPPPSPSPTPQCLPEDQATSCNTTEVAYTDGSLSPANGQPSCLGTIPCQCNPPSQSFPDFFECKDIMRVCQPADVTDPTNQNKEHCGMGCKQSEVVYSTGNMQANCQANHGAGGCRQDVDNNGTGIYCGSGCGNAYEVSNAEAPIFCGSGQCQSVGASPNEIQCLTGCPDGTSEYSGSLAACNSAGFDCDSYTLYGGNPQITRVCYSGKSCPADQVKWAGSPNPQYPAILNESCTNETDPSDGSSYQCCSYTCKNGSGFPDNQSCRDSDPNIQVCVDGVGTTTENGDSLFCAFQLDCMTECVPYVGGPGGSGFYDAIGPPYTGPNRSTQCEADTTSGMNLACAHRPTCSVLLNISLPGANCN